MLKQQIEPYQKFAQHYYVDRDTAHNFRHIERIISRLVDMDFDTIAQNIYSI